MAEGNLSLVFPLTECSRTALHMYGQAAPTAHVQEVRKSCPGPGCDSDQIYFKATLMSVIKAVLSSAVKWASVLHNTGSWVQPRAG